MYLTKNYSKYTVVCLCLLCAILLVRCISVNILNNKTGNNLDENEDYLNLKEGEDFELKSLYIIDDKLSYTSSNNDILYVNETTGFLIAKKVGNAEITVKNDENNYLKKLQVEVSSSGNMDVIEYKGYDEGIAVTINDNKGEDVKVYYLNQNDEWIKVDSELVRQIDGNHVRADILGLSKDKYLIKIIDSNQNVKIIDNINVTNYDRSGYAHFDRKDNTIGVGAYNDDGTLKENAVVLYVDDKTKNTVQLKIDDVVYTGLVDILTNLDKLNRPIALRILGRISTTQFNYVPYKHKSETKEHAIELMNFLGYSLDNNADNLPDGWVKSSTSSYIRIYEDQIISNGINSESEDINNGITRLDGLNKYNYIYVDNSPAVYDGVSYPTFDYKFNRIFVKNVNNVTIEGVGTDAEIYQFGIYFTGSSSIEIRNLAFSNYQSGVISFRGDQATTSVLQNSPNRTERLEKHGNYWVHNNTFNRGKLKWDVRDKYVALTDDNGYKSDETNPYMHCHGVTVSYNHFNAVNKTHLIGSSDEAYQYNFTLHHNFYDSCVQRVPLARHANIHIYNNYYYKNSTTIDARASVVIYAENNYFEDNTKVFSINSNSADNSNTKIKEYNNFYVYDNNEFDSSSIRFTAKPGNLNNILVAKNRDDKSDTENYANFRDNYSNFDTDSNLFYYNSNNKVSDVYNMLNPKDVKEFCMMNSGTLK